MGRHYSRHVDPPLRLSREQVRGIDRVCIEEYGIPGVILMENAARGLFDVAREMLVGNGAGRVLIVCGGGNNGDDGYALARHLHNAGFDVLLAVARPTGELAGDAATNAAICVKMGLPVEQATPQLIATAPADLVVDALFGTGLAQPPRSDAVVLICAMNVLNSPFVTSRLPSSKASTNTRWRGCSLS